MSNQNENGQWVTVRGRHIFIKDGESIESALNGKSNGIPKDRMDKKAIASYQKLMADTIEKYIDAGSEDPVRDADRELGKIQATLDKTHNISEYEAIAASESFRYSPELSKKLENHMKAIQAKKSSKLEKILSAIPKGKKPSNSSIKAAYAEYSKNGGKIVREYNASNMSKPTKSYKNLADSGILNDAGFLKSIGLDKDGVFYIAIND